MRTLALCLMAALPVSLPAFADNPPPSLVVTGEGHVDMAPDIAIVSVGVTTDGATAGEALGANSGQVAAVLAALAEAGIAPRDIQTSGLSLNPLWDNIPDRDGRQRIVGYQATNTVTIRARDLAGLGALLDKVVSTGANQLNGLSFALSDPKAAMDAARQKAVADALDRAKLYAEAAGVTLGPIMTLIEGSAYQEPQPMFRRDMAMAAPVPIAGGEVGVSATVTVTFGIGE